MTGFAPRLPSFCVPTKRGVADEQNRIAWQVRLKNRAVMQLF